MTSVDSGMDQEGEKKIPDERGRPANVYGLSDEPVQKGGRKVTGRLNLRFLVLPHGDGGNSSKKGRARGGWGERAQLCADAR